MVHFQGTSYRSHTVRLSRLFVSAVGSRFRQRTSLLSRCLNRKRAATARRNTRVPSLSLIAQADGLLYLVMYVRGPKVPGRIVQGEADEKPAEKSKSKPEPEPEPEPEKQLQW